MNLDLGIWFAWSDLVVVVANTVILWALAKGWRPSLTVRSTPDPSLTLSQCFIEAHQYSIYAPIMRLGPGRSTLALGTIGAPTHRNPQRFAAWMQANLFGSMLYGMTWIVGVSSLFGYGAIFSDVQVTFGDGTTKDILQKAYSVGPYIGAGFAGSVLIGFNLLQSLANFLYLPDGAENSVAWDPLWVSNNWGPLAKKIFDSAPLVERKLGSRILIVGASPDQSIALGPKIYISRFSSPEFIPGIMAQPQKICSIGSGAGVAVYKHSIKPLFRLTSGILKAEIGQSNGWARAMGFSISHTLAEHPRDGISKYIHTVIVRRGSIVVENNDEKIHYPDGSIMEVRMPPVAQNYEDFLNLAKLSSNDASGAAC